MWVMNSDGNTLVNELHIVKFGIKNTYKAHTVFAQLVDGECVDVETFDKGEAAKLKLSRLAEILGETD